MAYTLTIEQTGGSGITVPGYGFLLNNELTDFNFAPLAADVPDPNLPGPGQASTLVDEPDDGRRRRDARLSWPAAPGGASIITTVAQIVCSATTSGGSRWATRFAAAAAVLAQRCERAGRAGPSRPARSAPGSPALGALPG